MIDGIPTKGLGMMLRALYPKLDWSTPEATFKSLGIDPRELIGQASVVQNAVVLAVQRLDDMALRLERIERMLCNKSIQHSIEGEVTSG